MPDSLLCNSNTEQKNRSVDYVGTGGLTWVFIIKPTSTSLDANYHWLAAHGSGGAGNGAFGIALSGLIRAWNGSAEASSSITIPAADEWYLIAYSKAGGTNRGKMHLYRYSTNTWQHENTSSTFANWGAPSIPHTMFSVAGENYDGNVLIYGVWDSCLSDAQIETLAIGRQAWIDATPKSAWRANGRRIVPSFIPGDRAWTAEGASAAWGTADPGDAPTGWSDGVSGISIVGQNGSASTVVTSTTLAMTFDRTIPVGEQAFICFVHGTGNGAVSGIVDTGGNTWTPIQSLTPNLVHDFWWCPSITTQINPGDTATATWSISNGAERAMLGVSFSGLVTSSVLDQTTSGSGTSTTPDTGSTATTSQADELVLGSLHVTDSSGGNLITPDVGTSVYNHTYEGANHSVMVWGKILTAVGTPKLSGVLGTSNAWSAAAITLKGARAGGVPEITKAQRSRQGKLRNPVRRR